MDFNEAESASIKSFAVKKKMSQKRLQDLCQEKSFIYSFIEIFSFPDLLVK